MITIEGLLLHSTNYLGKKKILKVFTKEKGLLSFFSLNSKLTPFCLCEWSYREEDKEMLLLKEENLIDPLLSLREDYETIQAAGAIAKSLLKTQLPHKKGEELFDLTYLFFKRLHESPKTMLLAFKLKLLFFEGVFPASCPAFLKEHEWEEMKAFAKERSLSKIQSLSPSFSSNLFDAFFDAVFNF